MTLHIRRHLIQTCAAILYNANAFTPLTEKAVDFPYTHACVPGLNCQYCRYTIAGCPLGVTQQALSGTFSAVAWQFWGLLVLFGLLFGRMICGWACPMGWLQELLAKAPFPKLKKEQDNPRPVLCEIYHYCTVCPGNSPYIRDSSLAGALRHSAPGFVREIFWRLFLFRRCCREMGIT